MCNTVKNNSPKICIFLLTSSLLPINLNYYKTDNSSMENEFIIERNGEVVPVEVKAGNTSSPSLNRFIEQFRPSEAYKFVDGNIGTTSGKITLPHYMAMFL